MHFLKSQKSFKHPNCIFFFFSQNFSSLILILPFSHPKTLCFNLKISLSFYKVFSLVQHLIDVVVRYHVTRLSNSGNGLNFATLWSGYERKQPTCTKRKQKNFLHHSFLMWITKFQYIYKMTFNFFFLFTTVFIIIHKYLNVNVFP